MRLDASIRLDERPDASPDSPEQTQEVLPEGRAVRRVEFNLPASVDVMIDGEIATLAIRSLDMIPAAVNVYI